MNEDEIIHQALSILEQRLYKPSQYMASASDTSNYLKLQFAGLEHETFRVMFLDSQHGVIQEKEMFRGTIDSASIYPREVVKAALSFNAAAVILSHNHPSGICEPSQADKNITKRLKESLALLDIKVLDHIVVGGSKSFSFAEHLII